MGKKKKKKQKKSLKIGGIDDYIKANRKASREIELETHVGWVAVDRPHKNKKLYDRKRDRRIELDDPFLVYV